MNGQWRHNVQTSWNYWNEDYASMSQQPIVQQTAIYSNGLVHNLPSTMINDQFGLAAFVVGQKANFECDLPDSVAQEVMSELEKEVLKNSSTNTQPMSPWISNFSGPLVKPSEPSVFATEPEIPLPAYLVAHRKIAENPNLNIEALRKSLTLKMDKFGEDLLFFVFYSFPQDVLEVVAAQHLYSKGWRYHMESQIWLHRSKTSTYTMKMDQNGVLVELGVYNYFNYQEWRVREIEGVIDFNKLEGPPQLPPLAPFIFKTNVDEKP